MIILKNDSLTKLHVILLEIKYTVRDRSLFFNDNDGNFTLSCMRTNFLLVIKFRFSYYKKLLIKKGI